MTPEEKFDIEQTISYTERLLLNIEKDIDKPLQDPKEFHKLIDRFITKGIEIKNKVVEIEVNPYLGNHAAIAAVFNKYKEWENTIKIIERANLNNIDISFVKEKSALPGGITLCNFRAFDGELTSAKPSQQAQNLLQNLKNEIDRRLEGLRKVKNQTNENIPFPTETKDKEIFIDKENGIYTNNKLKQPNYPIRGKRSRLLWLLKDNKKLGRSLIKTLCYPSLSQLNKEIKEINNNFKSTLNLKDNLIVRVPTGGYKLNRNKYNIKFID
ncbi:MAG: hypothetical protein ABIG90_00995 [bacterium]